MKSSQWLPLLLREGSLLCLVDPIIVGEALDSAHMMGDVKADQKGADGASHSAMRQHCPASSCLLPDPIWRCCDRQEDGRAVQD